MTPQVVSQTLTHLCQAQTSILNHVLNSLTWKSPRHRAKIEGVIITLLSWFSPPQWRFHHPPVVQTTDHKVIVSLLQPYSSSVSEPCPFSLQQDSDLVARLSPPQRRQPSSPTHTTGTTPVTSRSIPCVHSCQPVLCFMCSKLYFSSILQHLSNWNASYNQLMALENGTGSLLSFFFFQILTSQKQEWIPPSVKS